MNIEIDTVNKTVRIKEVVDIKEFIKFLELIPDYKEYKIIPDIITVKELIQPFIYPQPTYPGWHEPVITCNY